MFEKEALLYRFKYPRVMYLSTAHLSAETAQYLQENDAVDFPCLGGHWGEIGWVFHVDQAFEEAVEFGGFSQDFADLKAIFEFGISEDLDMIVFVDTADVDINLKIYREEVIDDHDEFTVRHSSRASRNNEDQNEWPEPSAS